MLWLGYPGKILEAAALGEITLYTSIVLVEELRSTLAKPRLAARIRASGLSADVHLERWLAVALLVAPTSVPRVVPNDPDDDHVVAAAVAAQADIIVSGDDDLRSLGTFAGVSILSAREAADLISIRRLG